MGLIMAMTADSSRGQSGGGQVALDLACWLRDEIPTQSPVVFCGGGRVLGAKPDGEEGCVAGGERGQGYSSASRALDLVEVVRQLLEPQESRSERLRHVLALLDPRFRVHLNVCVCVCVCARARACVCMRAFARIRAQIHMHLAYAARPEASIHSRVSMQVYRSHRNSVAGSCPCVP